MLEGRWFVAAFALGMLITALVWAHLRDHERDLEKAHHAAAADRLVQARLAAHGIRSQTPAEIAPVQLRYAEDLEIALASGFASAAHFSKCYRATYGSTPYRHRGAAEVAG